jgi:hypothetical protein
MRRRYQDIDVKSILKNAEMRKFLSMGFQRSKTPPDAFIKRIMGQSLVKAVLQSVNHPTTWDNFALVVGCVFYEEIASDEVLYNLVR